MSQLTNLSVLGSGVLGGQIAWHSASKGKNVVVLDNSAEAIARCKTTHQHYAQIYQQELGLDDQQIELTQSRLSYTTDLAAAVAEADLVVEAVPEVPEVKLSVYHSLAPLLPAHTLLASNSSTFLPQDFADATGRPEKFCAMHFANLIWRMNIVEIMAHPHTAPETLVQATEFGIEIGMRPIPVQKQQNGYVINTWFVALLNAAQSLVTNGVSTAEDVDRSYLICNKGASMGPMALMDVVGMETAFNVLQYWGTVNQDEQMLANANFIQNQFLDKGLYGLQTGEGYYKYPEPSYQQADFLAVPDISEAPALAARAVLSE